MKIQTVIFDWDGTLHNTAALYGNAFRAGYEWLVRNGYAPEKYYSDEDAAQFIGINSVNMWKMFMPQLPESITEIPRRIIGEKMVSAVEEGTARLYPGALDVLSRLKEEGYKLAFLSNCRISYMEAHRKYFELDRYFDRMYNCEVFGWISKAEIFKTLRDELPGGYIMIGDRGTDLAVAHTWGFPGIGCAYGFPQGDELSSAEYIADGVSQIPELIFQAQEAAL